MAAGIVRPGPLVPLEDTIDLLEFLEATGRTIPRVRWAEECVEAAKQASIERMLG